jgi:putative ABC transport system ATP-binding protein
MKKDVVISLKNVWKTYVMGETKLHAAREISLDIKKGEFIVVVGPSGAGKSTIMNLIGCLDFPSKGKIYLNNKDVTKMSESELAQIRGKTIGFIFQQFNLIQTLSAEENVFLPMSFQGTSRGPGIKKARELLTGMGLAKRTHHKPTELSGGERQRVAISRALANSPRVILADEPTGNLDSKTGKEVMDWLGDIHKEGATVVLITHDTSLVSHGERTIFLKDGIIEKVINNHKKRGVKRVKSKK